MAKNPSVTIEIKGLKGAGKTTIAEIISEALEDIGINVTLFDGDSNHAIHPFWAPVHRHFDDRPVVVIVKEGDPHELNKARRRSLELLGKIEERSPGGEGA